jgi:hypothetical protein
MTYTADYTVSGSTLTISASRPAPSASDVLIFFSNLTAGSPNTSGSSGTSGSAGTSGVAGAYSIVSVTSTPYNATQTSGQPVLLVNTTTAGSNVTINLPTAVSNTAQFVVKKVDSGAFSVIIDGNSTQTIDGSLTATMSVPYQSINMISDNSNWLII